MSPRKRSAQKHAKARQRRRLQAPERLERDRRQAPRAAAALHQARQELGVPQALGAEIEGRLRSQHKLLGTIVGVMVPALLGCRTPSALCRVRGGDTQGPARLRGALPKRSWLKRRRRWGLDVWAPLWRHVAHKSPATQRRGQGTWGGDDAVCKKEGQQRRVGGHWWRGQHPRVLSGMDGLLLLVVLGDGRGGIPVDCAMRRPAPGGPGAPCRDKRRGARVRLDAWWAACARRGAGGPAPSGGADRGVSDSQLLQYGGAQHQGPLLVEGTPSSTWRVANGQQGKGSDLLHGAGWSWRQAPWEAGVASVRLRATRPTDAQVPIVLVDAPGQDRCSLLCVETTRSAPQLIRRWRRRTGMAFVLRTLQHLWAPEACQAHSEDAD